MKEEKKAIRQVKDYIERQLNEGMKLDDIAKAVGYSKFHLNRLFKEEMGTTIHQYILKRRIEQSAELLLKTNQTVLEVALNSGYTTQQSYTVAFRQIYEMTPQGYRIRYIQNHMKAKALPDGQKTIKIQSELGSNRFTKLMIRQSEVIQLELINQTKEGIAA